MAADGGRRGRGVKQEEQREAVQEADEADARGDEADARRVKQDDEADARGKEPVQEAVQEWKDEPEEEDEDVLVLEEGSWREVGQRIPVTPVGPTTPTHSGPEGNDEEEDEEEEEEDCPRYCDECQLWLNGAWQWERHQESKHQEEEAVNLEEPEEEAVNLEEDEEAANLEEEEEEDEEDETPEEPEEAVTEEPEEAAAAGGRRFALAPLHCKAPLPSDDDDKAFAPGESQSIGVADLDFILSGTPGAKRSRRKRRLWNRKKELGEAVPPGVLSPSQIRLRNKKKKDAARASAAVY